jgi:FAD/FMN-containing dehydrogenase
LAGLVGSSSGVGVVGYTLGGGFGWLGRKYGFNAESIREADLVTADGEQLRVDAYEHPDLFWGLKGSADNFGIVTSLEFALFPLTTVYGGGLYYPVERAAEALNLYQQWAAGLPDEMTPSVLSAAVTPSLS